MNRIFGLCYSVWMQTSLCMVVQSIHKCCWIYPLPRSIQSHPWILGRPSLPLCFLNLGSVWYWARAPFLQQIPMFCLMSSLFCCDLVEPCLVIFATAVVLYFTHDPYVYISQVIAFWLRAQKNCFDFQKVDMLSGFWFRPSTPTRCLYSGVIAAPAISAGIRRNAKCGLADIDRFFQCVQVNHHVRSGPVFCLLLGVSSGCVWQSQGRLLQ